MNTTDRYPAIDWTRGIVMVLMALDHVRFFFSDVPFPPGDMRHTWPALFFTRWVTHYCAPVFFFLAGTSAYLGGRRRSPAEQTRYLLTRGLWLVVLELTVIGFAWSFRLGQSFAGVIWSLGWSMVILAFASRLRASVLACGGLVLVATHQLILRIDVGQSGFEVLWRFLHVPGMVELWPGFEYRILFPIIPWFALMLLGYGSGSVWERPAASRQAVLAVAGGAATLLFVILRAVNAYGNPTPFQHQTEWPMTVVAFLNVEKYPPSLHFALMTMGPALILLAFADRWVRGVNLVSSALILFGRVPLFYYVCHLYLIHLAAVAAPRVGLVSVWAIWLLVVIVLYFPSAWFARIKRQRRDWWLSYT